MNRRMFAIRMFAMQGGLVGAALLLSPAATAGDGGNDNEKMKRPVDSLIMFSIAVTDMPKAKAFYSETLGFKVTSDSRRDDHNWWVGLAVPEGRASVILTTAHENMKPGTMKVYFSTSDVVEAHKELSAKGAKVNEVTNDLFGPGSGVKWFSLADPDGNQILLVQPRGR
jgi:predicted enzyme related to lactoylglutathione lyase